ncbi:ATP-binding protein [Actinomadura decatromicini]|uniref:ATP-binding protein n=1 Tax=Actinomadura decatromicini TaxID=2604572 RepID=A0A5D3FGA1_9ACTN|nr:ATP-binding protein [Actinomadura decatromicini]TYK47119.1 ATP-binding protein [Actinomadura decatromicini]
MDAATRKTDQTNQFAVRVTACRETVYLTRDLVRSSLNVWGLNAYRSDACQIMSELASNAARYCVSEKMCAWVSRLDVGIEMCVWDDHPGRPLLQTPGYFGAHGRGLIIVQAFATGGCGWAELAAGKVVWARIAIDERFIRAAALSAGCPIVGALPHMDRTHRMTVSP